MEGLFSLRELVSFVTSLPRTSTATPGLALRLTHAWASLTFGCRVRTAVRLLLKRALLGCPLLWSFSCAMHSQLLHTSTSQALSLPRFPSHHTSATQIAMTL
jgi:hypothetical protein